jgi:polysaccharide pyruvyl transferase
MTTVGIVERKLGRVLLAGWFSFENGHATAGDVLVKDEVCRWLACAGRRFDVALAPPFSGGVDWRSADPAGYSDVVFVCGPFSKGELEAQFLSRYAECRLIGVNLSMGLPLSQWSPFDFLVARDSDVEKNPDVVFIAESRRVPLIGLCQVEPHPEAKVDEVNKVIDAFLQRFEATVIPIDTRLDRNETGLRSPAEVETAIASMDALITTRLHGLVLALKNRVPAVALDAVPGGGKILHQARRIGWPLVFSVDDFSKEQLSRAVDWSLTAEARHKALECAALAQRELQDLRDTVVSIFAHPEGLEGSRRTRTAPEHLRRFRAEMDEVVRQAEAAEAALQGRESREAVLPRVFRRLGGMFGRVR